ncbi:MAG: 50S ribosomal protein L4 [Candidatus Omnitrophota bacterium]
MEQVSKRLQVYGLNGKAVDNIQLDDKLFDGRVNKVILYETVKMYEANRRRGTASTKTRAEVSGGGIKPWKQKGTGRARVGSSRNPLWRHGGTTFGPRPHSFSLSVNKKVVKKALLSMINARLSEKMVKSVVKIEVKEPKTKEFKAILDNLNMEGKTLVVVDTVSRNVKLASANLKNVRLMEGRNINARDILVHDSMVIEKEAFEKLVERLK